MGSRPLTIAIAAAALLVVSLGVDASMNRSLSLDVREDDGAWRTIGSDAPYTHARPVPVEQAGVSAAANDTITLRLRVDNGYPWAYDERYRVFFNGRELASGTLEAGARGEGESVFTVPAKPFWDTMSQRPPGEPAPQVAYAHVEVYVDGKTVYGNFQIHEASA